MKPVFLIEGLKLAEMAQQQIKPARSLVIAATVTWVVWFGHIFYVQHVVWYPAEILELIT